MQGNTISNIKIGVVKTEPQFASRRLEKEYRRKWLPKGNTRDVLPRETQK